MTSKTLSRIANNTLRGLDRATVSTVASLGWKGALPEGLTEEERFELLNHIQDTAKCVEAGAFVLV